MTTCLLWNCVHALSILCHQDVLLCWVDARSPFAARTFAEECVFILRRRVITPFRLLELPVCGVYIGEQVMFVLATKVKPVLCFAHRRDYDYSPWRSHCWWGGGMFVVAVGRSRCWTDYA